MLTSVTVAYLPRNTRPVVTSVTVHPPGVVFQRPFSSEDGAIAGLDDAIADARRPPGDPGPPPPAPGRRMFQKGLQTIAWKAEDADTDRLSYTLQYRREGETAWRELADRPRTTRSSCGTRRPSPTAATSCASRASDAPSNAADRALTGERDSDPIDVDNTPPVVTTEITRQGGDVAARGPRPRRAEPDSETGVLARRRRRGRLVYPADGLADSPEERYEIPLANDADAARIVLRATRSAAERDVASRQTIEAGSGRARRRRTSPSCRDRLALLRDLV